MFLKLNKRIYLVHSAYREDEEGSGEKAVEKHGRADDAAGMHSPRVSPL